MGAAGLCLAPDAGGDAPRGRAEEIRPLRPDPRRAAAAAGGRAGTGRTCCSILLVGNIIYIGLVTIAQKKLDLMLGYSSVMHMGYIFLGIAALNVVGVSGAALLMFAHGLSIAALFAMAGMLRETNPTRSRSTASAGSRKPMPWLGFAFGLAAFASIGLPGFANFASEMMVFFGAFKPARRPARWSNYPARHRLRAVGRGHLRRLYAARLSRDLHGRSRQGCRRLERPGRSRCAGR